MANDEVLRTVVVDDSGAKSLARGHADLLPRRQLFALCLIGSQVLSEKCQYQIGSFSLFFFLHLQL
jgi:hypothetical protein